MQNKDHFSNILRILNFHGFFFYVKKSIFAHELSFLVSKFSICLSILMGQNSLMAKLNMVIYKQFRKNSKKYL